MLEELAAQRAEERAMADQEAAHQTERRLGSRSRIVGTGAETLYEQKKLRPVLGGNVLRTNRNPERMQENRLSAEI